MIRTLEWQTAFAELRAPCLRPLKADGNEPPAALRAAVDPVYVVDSGLYCTSCHIRLSLCVPHRQIESQREPSGMHE